MLKIKFTDVTGLVPEEFYPVPGKQGIPSWLNKLQPYINGRFSVSDGIGSSTAKRCIPMFDAVSCGYLIKLTHDIHISNQNGKPVYQCANTGLGVEFHSAEQLATHDAAKRGNPIPKLLNPWSIETPIGYSTLFIPPLNGDNSPILPFSGLVDTDKYFAPVNFPFALEPNFEGIVPAGMPIIQAIPVRRESWKIDISSGITDHSKKSEASVSSVFRNGYRKMFWIKKDYS